MEIQQEPVDDLSGNVDDLNTYMELRILKLMMIEMRMMMKKMSEACV